MGHFECAQHGEKCESYVVGGIESLNKRKITNENYMIECNAEERRFIETCLIWVD